MKTKQKLGCGCLGVGGLFVALMLFVSSVESTVPKDVGEGKRIGDAAVVVPAADPSTSSRAMPSPAAAPSSTPPTPAADDDTPQPLPGVPPLREGSPAPSREGALIPGVAAVDVYGNLTSKGFTLDGPYRLVPGVPLTWSLNRTTPGLVVKIDVTGEAAHRISRVKAVAINTTGRAEAGRAELGYLASLPYEGSEPARARAWVEEQWGREGQITIGGVRLVMERPSEGATWLTIEPE